MTSLEHGSGAISPDEADALARDAADPLTSLRDRFHLPTAPDGSTAIYLAGQSLGLQPRSARPAIERELAAWANLGVDAWFEPGRPWFTLDQAVREPMARVVGALPTEVALLNSLTVNLHLLLASFFRPDGRRRRILTDGPLFPSDRHALTTHLAVRGLDAERDLVVVGPRTGESTVRTEDLEAAIADGAGEIALVFLAGVNFATGQAHPIERLTAAGHAAGALGRLGPGPRRRQHRAVAPRLGRRRRRLVHLQVPERRAGLGRRDLRPRPSRARCVGAPAGRLVGDGSGGPVRPRCTVRAGGGRGRLGDLDDVDPGPRSRRRGSGHLRRGRHARPPGAVDAADGLPRRSASIGWASRSSRRATRRHAARSSRFASTMPGPCSTASPRGASWRTIAHRTSSGSPRSRRTRATTTCGGSGRSCARRSPAHDRGRAAPDVSRGVRRSALAGAAG